MQKLNRNLRIMLVMSLLQGMVFYAPIATLYRRAAGLTVFEITLIESICMLISMGLEVPWGVAAERLGYRRTMILCCMVYFVSKLVFWRAETFAGFLAERLLLAVVLAGMSGVDESILYASCGEGGAHRAFGWYSALGTAGMLLAAALYTLVIGPDYRRAALWTAAAYGAAALLSLGLEEVRRPAGREVRPFRDFRACLGQVWHTRGLLLLALAGAVMGESIHTITVFLSQLQYARCGWGDAMMGVAYTLCTAIGLCGAASAWCARRLGRRRMGLVLTGASAALCLVLAGTESGGLSLGCIAALCLASALYAPLSSAMQNSLITLESRATALSVSALVGDSAAALMNVVLGRAADASLPLALWVGAGACLAAAGLFALGSRRG